MLAHNGARRVAYLMTAYKEMTAARAFFAKVSST
jgi:hypothetical protein